MTSSGTVHPQTTKADRGWNHLENIFAFENQTPAEIQGVTLPWIYAHLWQEDQQMMGNYSDAFPIIFRLPSDISLLLQSMMLRLACVLLLLVLTNQLVSQLADASSIISREEPPSNGANYHSQRSLSNIIWGCISTTIICAWAAIHPNIPPREGPIKGTLRRLELMFWTIVAPEILPCWALNQRFAAMTVRDVYNDAKGHKKERCGFWETVKGWFSFDEIEEAASHAWTLKHGHFLIMGGFRVVEPPEEAGNTTAEANTIVDPGPASETTNVQLGSIASENADTEKGSAAARPKPKGGRVMILTLEMLEELVKDPEFEIDVTEEEIADRSKGDALSKIIFTLQSTWFILQCLGRRVQGLHLTHLELTTLALASLNGITFALWWHKPLGAQTPVRVHLKRKLTDVEREAGHRGESTRSKFLPALQESFGCFAPTSRWVIVILPLAIPVIPLFVIIAFAAAFAFTIIDLAMGESTSFPADARHVPTFYVPKHRYSESFHVLLLLALGTIFGAIHCAGWNLPFPTYAEQRLWRIASLAVTIIPIAAFPFASVIYLIAKLTLTLLKSSSDYHESLSGWTFIISMLAYVAARLVLLGRALVLLRHLPQTAFMAVDWTKFYPHFF